MAWQCDDFVTIVRDKSVNWYATSTWWPNISSSLQFRHEQGMFRELSLDHPRVWGSEYSRAVSNCCLPLLTRVSIMNTALAPTWGYILNSIYLWSGTPSFSLISSRELFTNRPTPSAQHWANLQCYLPHCHHFINEVNHPFLQKRSCS